MEKKKVKKEKIKILCIYNAAFALSTFFAFYIFLILANYCLLVGLDGLGAFIIVFGLPAAFLIGDFIYFLRQIKKKVEYDPAYSLMLFLIGTAAVLFFLKMILTVPI